MYSTTGDTDAGDHAFSWNGEDSVPATRLPPASYTLADFVLRLPAATSVATTTVVPGTVTSIVNSGGTTYLSVGGNQIPLSEVDTVGAGSTSSNTTTN